MSQRKILNFLKENKDKDFSVQSLAELNKMDKKTVYANLRKLKNHKNLKISTIQAKKGLPKNLYRFQEDLELKKTLNSVANARVEEPALALESTSNVISYLTLKEIRKIRKEMSKCLKIKKK